MGELTSKFSREDLETLVEAMGDWEAMGSQEYHFLQLIENAAMPPEDHEAYEVVHQIKEYYRAKKQQILGNRALRQEKAVFLKAKLMLVRRDMQINDLFEMTEEKVPSNPLSPLPAKSDPTAQKKLELAEYFIKDLGVWEHYLKFLSDRQVGESDEPPEMPPQNSLN